jgi:hypothetical protein
MSRCLGIIICSQVILFSRFCFGWVVSKQNMKNLRETTTWRIHPQKKAYDRKNDRGSAPAKRRFKEGMRSTLG